MSGRLLLVDPLMSDYWGRVGVGGEGLAGVGEGEAM